MTTGMSYHEILTAARSPVQERRLFALVNEDASTPRSNLMFGSKICAACYAKPVLHIVTVSQRHDVQYELDDKRCGSFQFGERDPLATRTLQEKVMRFLRGCKIDQVILRSGAMRGAYVPHALGFKVEAILDLALGRSLLRAPSAGIANWLRKQEFDLPDPQDLGHSNSWRTGQRKAIEAGVYALAGGKLHSGEEEDSQ